MSGGRRARRSAAIAAMLGCVAFPVGCYRAEFDVSDWLADRARGGSSGASNLGGDGGSGGSAAVACDDSPLDDAQRGCSAALPTRIQCSEQDVAGWSGCYDGGCSVCTDSLLDYPYYFKWHPCCQPNDSCNSNSPKKCHALCPAPTEKDKLKPCFAIEVDD